MYYKFRKDFAYSTSCIVEADSLEEAKRLQEDAEWETENGGDHYLEGKFIFASESDEDLDDGELIEDKDW